MFRWSSAIHSIVLYLFSTTATNGDKHPPGCNTTAQYASISSLGNPHFVQQNQNTGTMAVDQAKFSPCLCSGKQESNDRKPLVLNWTPNLKKSLLGPVHTNPFSNENGAVFSVFKKISVHLIVFVSFLYVHTSTPYLFENAVIPSVRMVKWTRRMRISIHRPAKLARNWSYMVAPVRHFGYSRSGGFDDVTVFREHRFHRPHYKTAISKSIVFKSLHCGERFRMAPFSVIVFGVVVWTIAVSGAKQLRFRLKTD